MCDAESRYISARDSDTSPNHDQSYTNTGLRAFDRFSIIMISKIITLTLSFKKEYIYIFVYYYFIKLLLLLFMELYYINYIS